MKINIFILGLLMLFLFATFVTAQSITLDFPSNYLATRDTAFNFNWTSDVNDGNNVMQYLFIDSQGLGYDNYSLNRSVDCNSNASCNISVAGFDVGQMYQWYVQSAYSSTNASLVSSNSESFDFITGETVASITGGNLELFNFSANNTLDITYTLNGSKEDCSVTLAGGTVSAATIGTNITAAGCNVTGSNSSGFLKIVTLGSGSDEYINVSGNATGPGILNLTSYVVYNGSQVSNNSLSLNYTINGDEQSCTATISLSDSVLVSEVISNITDSCNVSALNQSGALNLTSKGQGSDEFILVIASSALPQLGISAGTNSGSESNVSSTSRWLEIRPSNTSTDWYTIVNNTIIFGNLNVTGVIESAGGFSGALNWTDLQGYPAACPAGTYLTQLNDSVTCTAAVKISGDNRLVGDYEINGSMTLRGDLLGVDDINGSDLYVENASISGALTVGGASTLAGDVTITTNGLVISRDTGNGYIKFQNASNVLDWNLQRLSESELRLHASGKTGHVYKISQAYNTNPPAFSVVLDNGQTNVSGALDVGGALDVDGITSTDGIVDSVGINTTGALNAVSGAFSDIITSTVTDTTEVQRFIAGSTDMGWVNLVTDDGIHIALEEADGEANNNLILTTSTARRDDYDHSTPSADPTLFIQSRNRSAQATDEWISFSHNTTDGIIDVGSGNLVFKDTVKLANGATIYDNSTCLLMASPDGTSQLEVCNS